MTPGSAMDKARTGTLPPDEVRQMFDTIAPRYDLANRLMTAGLDRSWRRQAAASADLAAGERALDLCTGTGDLALELADRVTGSGEVVGLDASPEMLVRARQKAEAAGARAVFVEGDACDLPFEDDAFDAATVAFGARNLPDLDAGLREMARVVRPGGRVVVLEITTPRHLKAFYGVWFDRIVPVLGGMVAGDRAAYSYLPASVRRFPGTEELARRMQLAGLEQVQWRTFAGGIVALHRGRVR